MGKFRKILKLDSVLAKSFLILCLSISNSHGATEMCIKKGTDAVYWLNSTNCAYGILFPEPIYVDCLGTTDADIKADVCKDTPVDFSGDQIQVQYIPSIDDNPIPEGEVCNAEDKCGRKGYMDSIWVRGGIRPPMRNKAIPWPDANSGIVNDAAVGNQTLRLFKHLIGLTENENTPVMRIVTLLRKSFQIMGKFCKAPYVPVDFGEDVLTAFLFLLAEADTSKILDVPLEDYRRIDKALNDCLDKKNPFRFIGESCRIEARIDGINTTKGDVVTYSGNEFSWKSDKHDIPVEVTWATADFVHGLCYGTFKEHVNSHHLFQQAIERIFTSEIIYRWDKPILLARQEMYDHFFSANVRNAIHNLEYCVEAAYYDAPFLHRLERMLLKYTPKSSSRKKRSVYPMETYNRLEFYCFAKDETRDEMLEMYKNTRC